MTKIHIEYSVRIVYILTGVGGAIPGHPEMGVIIEDGEELDEVVFSPYYYYYY
jgi:hypothetical protein